MKIKYIYYFFTVIAVMFFSSYWYLRAKSRIGKSMDVPNEILIGVYDQKEILPPNLVSNIQSFSIQWKGSADWSVEETLQKAISEDKNLLITIETWPDRGLLSNSVLQDVLSGRYDQKIETLARALNLGQGSVYIRWNPEMEVPVKKYPWQYQSPYAYMDAFNYFSAHLKHLAPQVKMVWSPAGFPGDSEYWPGKEQVDAISITLDSRSEKLSGLYPTGHLSTLEKVKQKLHRMRFMDKPVLVLSADKKVTPDLMGPVLQQIAKSTEPYRNTVYSAENFKGPYQRTQSRKELILGAYDPDKDLVSEPQIKAEHLFTNWGELKRGEFLTKFNEVIARKHDVIVTMEPWRDTLKKEDPQMLQSILQGKYDREIAKLYSIISNVKQTVYLRWTHEMEIPIHRYPWQSQDPVVYINCFRYFMNFPKVKPENIRRIWGPAGDRGSVDWYPGDDVVDYVSIAIYGLPDKNITDENQQELFSDIFRRKNYRMRFINKPLFITEFGVKGSEKYQNKWLEDAAKTIRNNPTIFGASYFNQHDDPKAWGDIKPPVWKIGKESFKKFCNPLKGAF
ncbi:MAG TPA: hypothetical protein VEV16_03130 [Daejeonella sp.]|nr:hypothetical protein [Daejeonella sp.]